MTTETKQAQHTPGPWTVNELSTPPHDLAVFGPDQMAVAKIYLPLNYNKGQADANARLIAACPTMYDYIAKKAGEGDAEAKSIIAAI